MKVSVHAVTLDGVKFNENREKDIPRWCTSSVKTISQSLSETVAAFVSITVINRRFQCIAVHPGIYESVMLSSSCCKS